MKKLLIVDGNSILNRAFYGVHPLSNKEGLPTNAVFGFTTILKRHLDEIKPEYAVISFDLKAKTFRHKEYDFYKANRKPMPPDLAAQMPYAKECAKDIGFNIVEIEGYEADDVLGTVARIGSESDMDIHSFILTGDRDSLQLINNSTSVILVKTKEDIIYNEEKFKEDYGVSPKQYIDVKAIMGDSSDNIPGIAGIGEKGAFKLISDFSSLDNLYDTYMSSSLSENLKAKISNGKDMAYVSKYLATIVTDVPIEKSTDDFIYRGIDNDKTYDLFRKLEFGSLIKKFNLSLPSINEIPSENKEEIVSEDASYVSSFDEIKNKTISVYTDDSLTYVFGDGINVYSDTTDIDSLLRENKIICHDLKGMLYSHGEINCVFDTFLAAYVISPTDSDYDLSTLATKYLSVEFSPKDGAKIIHTLYGVFDKILTETETKNILTAIEIPLAHVLYEMETEGFRVDTEGLISYGETLDSMANSYKDRIFMECGEEFNINSPKQLGEVLFEKMGLRHGKKNKNGYSTSADVLEELRYDYPVVDDILEYRQITKLKSTFCDGLIKVAKENGIIHTTFNQTVTATGRLSSTEPNLQNIPIRTDLGRQFREYFVTKNDDYVLIDADYSQIELKVLAHLSGDANMIYAFNSGLDIHAITASQVFRIPPEDVTPELRKRAKAVNFGIVYGIGEFSLAKDLGIKMREAKEYIESYFYTYPDVHAYITGLKEFAKENGYAKTMFGRRRYIPEIKSANYNVRSFGERVAMNSPIQGTAADIIKIAMIRVSEALKREKLDAKLILQVHDELIIEANKKDADAALKILKHEMENAVKLSVPLTADCGTGKTWLEAK